MFVVRCGRQRTRQYSYCCRTRHYLHVITKLTTTQTQTLSPSFPHRIPSSNTSKDHRPLRSTEISHNHNEKSSTFAFFSTNCLFLLYEEEEEEEEKKRSLLATPPRSVQKHSLLKPFQIRKSSQFSKNSTSQTPDTNYTKIKKDQKKKKQRNKINR